MNQVTAEQALDLIDRALQPGVHLTFKRGDYINFQVAIERLATEIRKVPELEERLAKIVETNPKQ